MTIKELIHNLQQLPEDYDVLVADWNEDYRDPMPLGGTHGFGTCDTHKCIVFAGECSGEDTPCTDEPPFTYPEWIEATRDQPIALSWTGKGDGDQYNENNLVQERDALNFTGYLIQGEYTF